MDLSHPNPLGYNVTETTDQGTRDAFNELTNKIGWAIGSTFGAQYRNKNTIARQTAAQLALEVILAHGYPASAHK